MRMKLYSQVLDVCVIYAACSTKLEQLNPTAKHKIHRFFSPEDDVRAQGGSLLPEGQGAGGPLDCWSRTPSTSSSTPRQAAGQAGQGESTELSPPAGLRRSGRTEANPQLRGCRSSIWLYGVCDPGHHPVQDPVLSWVKVLGRR